MLTNFCCFLFILYIISLFSLYRLYIINHFHVIGKKDFEMIYYHFIFSFTAIILKMIFLVRRLKNLKNNFYDQPEIFTECLSCYTKFEHYFVDAILRNCRCKPRVWPNFHMFSTYHELPGIFYFNLISFVAAFMRMSNNL